MGAMGGFLGGLAGIVILGLVIGVEFGWFAASAVYDTALIAIAVAGLISVTKVPWDLYLQASAVDQEQRRSKELGLEVVDADVRATRRMKRWLLLSCFGLHLILAAGAAGVAAVRDAPMGYAFAVAFVAASGLRPAWALYVRLSQRLARMMGRAQYPRDDVLELRRRLEEIAPLALDVPRLWERLDQADKGAQQARDKLDGQIRAVDSRITGLRRSFEDAVEHATEDADALRGLKALSRLIKSA